MRVDEIFGLFKSAEEKAYIRLKADRAAQDRLHYEDNEEAWAQFHNWEQRIENLTNTLKKLDAEGDAEDLAALRLKLKDAKASRRIYALKIGYNEDEIREL